MKRVFSIIIITTIIFFIGFAFLRVQNEEFAATLLDDTGLDSKRIRKNRAAISAVVNSGDVASGTIMSGEIMTGTLFSGGAVTGEIATGTVVSTGSIAL